MNPPPATPPTSSFHWRNWWRNGWACKVVFGSALLCILALLQPWKASFTGYLRQGDYDVRTTVTPTDNAFHDGTGWVVAPILAAVLWVCGRPKSQTRGVRWLPLAGAIAVFACALSVGIELNRANEAWAAGFRHHKPVFQPPAGVLLTCWLSLAMAIAGWFFGRLPKAPPPPA